MFEQPKVSNIKIIDYKSGVITTDDKELNAKLLKSLPTRYSSKMTFTLDNVSHALANAIRRTISCELVIKSLVAEHISWKSNDGFLISEMILKRLRMIPLDQDTPMTASFKLIVINNTTELRDVKSGEIISNGNSKQLPFDSTYTICTLNPGKSLSIDDIYVQETAAYNAGDGMNAVANHVTSTALDVTPINWYEETNEENSPLSDPTNGIFITGIPSSIANPRKWEISFISNGNMQCNKIMIAACKNLITRINNVVDLLDTVASINGEYILNIEGESDTIGCLFMRTIFDMYPEIPFITYNTNNFRRVATLRIKTNEDVDTMITRAAKYLVSAFEYIMTQFK